MSVAQRHFDLDICFTAIGIRQRGYHLKIANLHRAVRSESDILPDSCVSIADCRNPIPSFRRGKGWAIDHLHAAVFTGAALDGLLLRNAWVGWRTYAHRQRVGP